MDEADLLGVSCTKAFPGDKERTCVCLTDLADNVGRNNRRSKTEFDFAEAKTGILRGDGNVACSHQSNATTNRSSVYTCYNWAGERIDGVQHIRQTQGILTILFFAEADCFLHHLYISSRAERFALCSEHYSMQLLIASQCCKCAGEILDELSIEGVVYFGTTQCNGCNLVVKTLITGNICIFSHFPLFHPSTAKMTIPAKMSPAPMTLTVPTFFPQKRQPMSAPNIMLTSRIDPT